MSLDSDIYAPFFFGYVSLRIPKNSQAHKVAKTPLQPEIEAFQLNIWQIF